VIALACGQLPINSGRLPLGDPSPPSPRIHPRFLSGRLQKRARRSITRENPEMRCSGDAASECCAGLPILNLLPEFMNLHAAAVPITCHPLPKRSNHASCQRHAQFKFERAERREQRRHVRAAEGASGLLRRLCCRSDNDVDATRVGEGERVISGGHAWEGGGGLVVRRRGQRVRVRVVGGTHPSA